MNIYLIRHGEKIDDEKNHESLGLTEKGLKQAELVGKRLKNYNIEKMYASNMKRAIQTAEQIDRFLNIGFDIVPDLREIHMGACETEGWEYLVREYPDFIAEFDKHESDLRYPPDGECGGDVWTRVSKFIDELVKSGLENVAIVTHGGVIRILIAGILQLNQAKRFYLGNPTVNCSISVIKYNERSEEFYLQCFNDYAHLENSMC